MSKAISLPEGRDEDVICVGHALMDRLSYVESDVVGAAGLVMGAMTLADEPTALHIAQLVPSWRHVSGGSAANTAVGVASLGGRSRFLGSVGADELGEEYERDLEAAGVACALGRSGDGHATGQCLVLVTPDAQRSMATHLGAGAEIDVSTVDSAPVGEAAIVYLEGYLLDSPGSADALSRVLELARSSQTPVALSLSDPYLVDRHGEALRTLVSSTIRVLFANEEEVRHLTGASDFGAGIDALLALGNDDLMAAVTRGAAGAELANRSERVHVDAWPLTTVEDTTGAGDLFAAGVLCGLVGGASLDDAGRLGALAAGEIVSHLGARPLTSLEGLATEFGLVPP